MKNLILATMFFIYAVPAFAHHSFTAEFDDKKPITLRGTLTKVELTNPHGWLYLNVKDPSGKVESWAIETGSPLTLLKQRKDNLGSLRRYIVGTWTQGNQKGDFKITRQ